MFKGAPPDRTLIFGVLLATLVIFLGDLLTPLGFAEAILYVIPLLLSSLLHDSKIPLRLAGACTILVIAGFFLSPIGAPTHYALLNRSCVVVMLWIVAVALRQLVQDRLTQQQIE